MLDTIHLSIEELEAGLDHIRRSPRDEGVVKMIVRRPNIDEREVVHKGKLDAVTGLIGDTWKTRFNKHAEDGTANIDAQVTIMNARTIALLAQSEERWSLAGDQLYIDMDLSDENIPTGTRLTLGTAILEVTPLPHTGCKKFAERFGTDATKFVNSKEGKRLHLRGINAKVIEAGEIQVSDGVRKV